MSIPEGWVLNPDPDIVMNVNKGLIHKGGYCPCRVGVNSTTLCPCSSFRLGNGCICGLYVRSE